MVKEWKTRPWEVFEGETWIHDSELKLTKGELAPCPGVNIFGSGTVMEESVCKSPLMGTFLNTPKMWNGYPVYKNNEGYLLHMVNDGLATANKLGFYSIRGLP